MRLALAEEAQQFGQVVRDALGSAGGDELIRHAEHEPAAAEQAVGAVLGELGVWDLDVGGDADQLEAAAAVCRSVGWWAAPGAVAQRLSRPRDLDVDALAVIGGPRPAAPMAGSALRWAGVDLDGRRSELAALPVATTPRSSGGVCGAELTPLDHGGHLDAVVGLSLAAWTLLGMMDRALADTVAYVSERQQFGKPLSAFQSVQFQLTEVEVERVGVEELAKYSLWSLATRRPDALLDALATRVAALEAADLVFRTCHQLHGAIGFCDETSISWVSRYSQPLRQLPMPLTATRSELVTRAGRGGLAGLFSQ